MLQAALQICCQPLPLVRRRALERERGSPMPRDHPLTLGRWMKRLRAALDLRQQARIEVVGCARSPSPPFNVTRAGRPERWQNGGQGAGSERRPSGAGPGAPPGPTLTVPCRRAELVARSCLRTPHDAGRAGSVTGIAAPAGSGKITLLAPWLSQGPGEAQRGLPRLPAFVRAPGWLPLDAADSDPIQSCATRSQRCKPSRRVRRRWSGCRHRQAACQPRHG